MTPGPQTRLVGQADPGQEARLAALAVKPPAAQPAAALAAAARAATDLIGVALAGAATPAARLVAATAAEARGEGSALVWGHGRRAPLCDAALANGFAAHALDFDDDETEIAMAHLSVTAMTAALTIAEALPVPVSGSRLLSAYINGCDIALALGARVNPGLYRAGWHATSALGVFAAAAAAATLLGLDEARVAQALRLAASLSGGLRGAFGGEGKPLQVAAATGSGLRAAILAHGGLAASPDAIFGPRGFVAVHGGDPRERPDGWPESQAGFPPPGFVVKRFPSCTATHAAVACLLDILVGRPEGAAAIRAIGCRVDPFVPQILLEGLPGSPDEARFNLAWCLASAALDGELGPDAFAPETLARPALADLMGRVTVTLDPDLPRGPSGISTGARVTVDFADGSRAERFRTAAPGSAVAPLAEPELAAKFTGCVAACHEPAAAATLFTRLIALPTTTDARPLLKRVLTAEPRR